jgi:hypothetical protein
VLHVILPVSFILGAGFVVSVGPVSVGFVVRPIALVAVAICVREFTFALGFVVLPLTLVYCSIWPLLPTPSITQITQPFTLVLNTVLEPNQLFPLSGGGSVFLDSLFALALVIALAVKLLALSEFFVNS